MLVAASYRLWLGGSGMWTGVFVIIATGSIGLIWQRFRSGSLASISIQELWVFGVAVHLVLLALMLTIPDGTAQQVLTAISLPILLIYPLATVALGLLLSARLKRQAMTAAVAESEKRYRSIFESANVGKFLIMTTDRLEPNQSFCDMLGYELSEMNQKSLPSLLPVDEQEAVEERLKRLLTGKDDIW